MSVINTNITSMIGQSNLSKSQSALQTSMERLSSGLRINSAKDDAAGQAIANRMSAQITGLAQAQRNANDGISLAQTAEGSLNQVNDNLQRIRELAVQAQNGTNSDNDLKSIQDEIGQRLSEIDRISKETNFNGVDVLASDRGLQIQVGANDGEQITVNLKEINSETLGLSTFNVDGSTRVDNEAATAADLEAQVPGGVWNADNTAYTVTPENAAATTSDVFAQLKDGDTVTKAADAAATPPTAAVDYTFDAASNSFTFANGETDRTAAVVQTEITGAIASGEFATGTVSIGGTDVDVRIADDGTLSTLNGEALYIVGNELTVTDNDNGNAPATVTTIFGDDAFGTGNAVTLSVNDKTYQTTAAGTAGNVDTSFTDSISAADLQTAAAADAADYTVDLGALYGGSFTFNAAGEAQSGTDAVYVSNGALTDQEFGAETTYTNTDGVIANADGEQLFMDAEGALTTETDRAGERTEDPLAALDSALNKIDNLRSELGAVQNRFGDAITNLNTNETNLSAARSRIEDADYAVEVANMTRAQILQQAGTSVLAQANQIPQSVLSLLG